MDYLFKLLNLNLIKICLILIFLGWQNIYSAEGGGCEGLESGAKNLVKLNDLAGGDLHNHLISAGTHFASLNYPAAIYYTFKVIGGLREVSRKLDGMDRSGDEYQEYKGLVDSYEQRIKPITDYIGSTEAAVGDARIALINRGVELVELLPEPVATRIIASGNWAGDGVGIVTGSVVNKGQLLLENVERLRDGVDSGAEVLADVKELAEIATKILRLTQNLENEPDLETGGMALLATHNPFLAALAADQGTNPVVVAKLLFYSGKGLYKSVDLMLKMPEKAEEITRAINIFTDIWMFGYNIYSAARNAGTSAFQSVGDAMNDGATLTMDTIQRAGGLVVGAGGAVIEAGSATADTVSGACCTAVGAVSRTGESTISAVGAGLTRLANFGRRGRTSALQEPPETESGSDTNTAQSNESRGNDANETASQSDLGPDAETDSSPSRPRLLRRFFQ